MVKSLQSITFPGLDEPYYPHGYLGRYEGDINKTDLNGLYWLVTANNTGTFPDGVSAKAYLEATGRYQKLSYDSSGGITCIQERYYENGKWRAWKRTDSLGKFALFCSNSSPNSSFGTQTISPSTLSEYKYIGVAATWDISNPDRALPFIIASKKDTSNGNYYYHGGYLSGKHVSDNTFVGRKFDITESGIVFSVGHPDNKSCIPFAIFGINP